MTDGNFRERKMLARQVTRPGSMDADVACTAPGTPNAGDNSKITAHAQTHA